MTPEFSTLWYYVIGFMIIDIILGSLGACKAGILDTEESFKGACKKVGILLVLVFALMFENAVKVPVFKVTAMFYMVYEVISIVENAVALEIPLPNIIKQSVAVFKQNHLDDQSQSNETPKT